MPSQIPSTLICPPSLAAAFSHHRKAPAPLAFPDPQGGAASDPQTRPHSIRGASGSTCPFGLKWSLLHSCGASYLPPLLAAQRDQVTQPGTMEQTLIHLTQTRFSVLHHMGYPDAWWVCAARGEVSPRYWPSLRRWLALSHNPWPGLPLLWTLFLSSLTLDELGFSS